MDASDVRYSLIGCELRKGKCWQPVRRTIEDQILVGGHGRDSATYNSIHINIESQLLPF